MSVWLAFIACDLFEGAIPDTPVDVSLIDHPSDAAPNTVEPWVFEVSVDAGTPFASQPGDQEAGPLLLLDAMARASGESGLVALSLTDLLVTGPPFELQVGITGGPALSLEPVPLTPVPPAACTIGVDPGAFDATAHAAEVLACLRAWVDANGAPTEPVVTMSIAGRSAGPASYGGTLHLEANENFEIGCDFDGRLPSDFTSEADYKLEDLHLAGYVGSVDHASLSWGFVVISDGNDQVVTSASAAFDLEAASAVYIGEEVSVSDPAAVGLTVASDPVPLAYVPGDVGDWNQASYEALLGDGDVEPGTIDTCWGSLHQGVPNRMIVIWTLLGTGAVQL